MNPFSRDCVGLRNRGTASTRLFLLLFLSEAVAAISGGHLVAEIRFPIPCPSLVLTYTPCQAVPECGFVYSPLTRHHQLCQSVSRLGSLNLGLDMMLTGEGVRRSSLPTNLGVCKHLHWKLPSSLLLCTCACTVHALDIPSASRPLGARHGVNSPFSPQQREVPRRASRPVSHPAVLRSLPPP